VISIELLLLAGASIVPLDANRIAAIRWASLRRETRLDDGITSLNAMADWPPR